MRMLHRVQLALGVWMIISPWVLGFASINLALWSNVITGALAVLLSVWMLFGNETNNKK